MYSSFDFTTMTTAAGHWLLDLGPEITFLVGLFAGAWFLDMAVDRIRNRRSSTTQGNDESGHTRRSWYEQ